MPTYFIVGGEDANPVDGLPADGGDLCKNLTFLGRAGCRRLPNGLKVAYLSERTIRGDSTRAECSTGEEARSSRSTCAKTSSAWWTPRAPVKRRNSRAWTS